MGCKKGIFRILKKYFHLFFYYWSEGIEIWDIKIRSITEDLNESHTRNDIRAAPAYHRRRRFFPSEVYRVHTVSKFRP